MTVLEVAGVSMAALGLAVIVWLCRCRHTHARREFRTPNGDPLPAGSRRRGVLHYVCDCGHAVPVIQRDASDAVKAKKLRKQVQPRPRNVADIRSRRQA